MVTFFNQKKVHVNAVLMECLNFEQFARAHDNLLWSLIWPIRVPATNQANDVISCTLPGTQLIRVQPCYALVL